MAYPKNAPRKPEVLGTFVLAVRTIKFPNGSVAVDVQASNERVPIDIVLINSRAWLKNMEQRYINNFADKFSDAL